MGLSKTELFTFEQNELAQMAKVLAHPARIAILQCLIEANACINSDLVEELGLAQPTISQHLRELKSIGLISGTIEGTAMNYCINLEKWNVLKHQFSQFFESFDSMKNCC